MLLRPGPAQQFVFCSRADFTRIHHDLVLNRRLTEQLVLSFVFVDFLSFISVTFGPDFSLFLLFLKNKIFIFISSVRFLSVQSFLSCFPCLAFF